MKNLFYLIVVALCVGSCDSGGYTVKGSIENVKDGAMVYMMKRVNRQFEKTDSAIISNGQFVFKGQQEKPENRYIVFENEEKPVFTDFFLENGTVQVNIAASGSTAKGTPVNNIYQEFKDKYQANMQKQSDLMKAAGSASDADRDAKKAELESAEEENKNIIKESIGASINSELGLFLLNQYNYMLDIDEIDGFLSRLRASDQNDERMVKLKERVEKGKKTAVGQKFSDFEMKTPEDKPVKLSDYAGKGKVVLVDFWASWCPPCRAEMPELVKLYADYKDKGFEIVGVSLDRTLEAWQKGIKDLNITWPQMSDLKYWESLGSNMYAVRSIPHLMVIDKDGTIAARGLHGDKLKEKIDELLK